MLNKKAQISEAENRKFSLTPICKKAQIGETMTWVVATLIIVFVLISSIYIASLLGKTKVIKNSIDSQEKNSIIELETQRAYEISSENKQIIESWIMEVEDEQER